MANLPSNVVITDRIAAAVDEYLSSHSYSKLALLVDENTYEHCYPLILDILPPHFIIKIASGEVHKNLATCEEIWEQMTDQQMDRQSILVNLGGGVIGDMGGFCAATFKRGLRFINLPTTLLAQVDASIGGKQGIDFRHYKNHLGVFRDPEMVFISTEFLGTLPFVELRSGFAEVVKHTLISDADYWHSIKKSDWDSQDWTQHVKHSIDTKSKVVQQDPYESGQRKILNFGHTIGHAIEKEFLSTAQPLLHGEAIAIGMITEAYLSHQKLHLAKEDLRDITHHLFKWFGKVRLDQSVINPVVKNTLQDKKNFDGKIQCTLLQNIGQAVFNIEVTPQEITGALEYYREQTG